MVTHPTRDLVFPKNGPNLADSLGRHLHLLKTIYGVGHVPMYLVYRYDTSR